MHINKLKEVIDFEIVVSIPQKFNEDQIEQIKKLLNPYKIIQVENKGRDILPFIKTMKAIKDDGFKYACKIHTKKSPHLHLITHTKYNSGEDWRKNLWKGLLNKYNALAALDILKSSEDTGMCGPKEFFVVCDHEELFAKNLKNIDKIKSIMSIDSENEDFLGGSMFWFKLKALSSINEFDLKSLFGPEKGLNDGTMAHAFERMFPIIIKHNGYKLKSYKTHQTNDPYVIFSVAGGIGKNIMATAVITSIKKAYPNHKIVVISGYPEVFLNNPKIFRVYKFGNTPYFMQDYIDSDTIIMQMDPYHHNTFIHKKKHLIESWCDVYNIKCVSKQPEIFLTQAELDYAKEKFARDKPLFVIQTNGGAANENSPNSSWARDIPINQAQEIVNLVSKTHHVMHIRKPTQLSLDNTETMSAPLRELFSLIAISDKRLFNESFAYHCAAAFKLPSTVCFIGTKPKVYSYSIHTNITPQESSEFIHSIDKYMEDAPWEGEKLYECPYDLENMFSIPKIFTALKKQPFNPETTITRSISEMKSEKQKAINPQVNLNAPLQPNTNPNQVNMAPSTLNYNSSSNNPSFVDNYFDKIYVINLDKRKDRWKKAQQQLINTNITTAKRVLGIEITDKELAKTPKKIYSKFKLNSIIDKQRFEKKYIKGQIGCRRAHLNCIKDAKKNSYKKILILEDDIVISPEINQNFSQVIDQTGDDWGLLYFGGDYWSSGEIYQTSSYAIDSSLFTTLINNWEKSGEEVDFFLVNNIQNKFKTYKIDPPLIAQLKQDSDIPTTDKITKSIPSIIITSPNGPIYKNQESKFSEKKIKPLTHKEIQKNLNDKRKNLFAITTGKYGKKYLKKIIKKFGHEDFDYLLFVYDNTKYNEQEFGKCEIIQEKIMKWHFAKKYLTKERYEKYKYIFFWDEDVDIINFNYKNALKLMDINGLELAQPALRPDSYHTWEITLQHTTDTGRFTNFVECGPALIFSNEALKKYLSMIDLKINKWGWGYGMIASTAGNINRMGILDSEMVLHTRPVNSIDSNAPKEMYNLFKKYNQFEYDFVNFEKMTGIKEFESKKALLEQKELERKQLLKQIEKFSYTPKISIVMPTFNTPLTLLKKTIKSITNQVYENWELCIADGRSKKKTKDVLKEFMKKDLRIKVSFLEKNLGIAGNSNKALSLAKGEFIALVDHDDILLQDSLFEIVKLLQKNPEADLIYTDEDKIKLNGETFEPYFKPNWSPDLLLSQNYISHLGVYRNKIIKEIGGFRNGFDGSQDHDLVLRFTEKTKNIFHIPKILYHWTSLDESMSNSNRKQCADNGKKAIVDALKRRKVPFKEVNIIPKNNPRFYSVRYELNEKPLVSIIIPTKDQSGLLKKCISSILSRTLYSNYEILVVNNLSKEEKILHYFSQLKNNEKIKIINYNKKFNFSAINNYAVSLAKGEYILFLNNDTKVISPDWIEAMLELCQRDDVGAVGAKLLYPNNTIQHAGIITGLNGVAGHSHLGYSSKDAGYFGKLVIISNLSAVTAACLMTKKKVFNEINGFDEKNLAIAFNDVDFCLKLREKGYLILYTPNAQLYHYEGATRGKDNLKIKRFLEENNFMKNKWKENLWNDPYYNPNLSLKYWDYRQKNQTRLLKKKESNHLTKHTISPKLNKDFFIATYTHEIKSYCDLDFFKNISKFTSSNYEIHIVDNTQHLGYVKKLKSICDNIGLKNATIDHLLTGKEPIQGQFHMKVLESVNYLRDVFLKSNCKYFLIIESDVIPPIDLLEKYAKVIDSGDIIGGIYYKGNHLDDWFNPEHKEKLDIYHKVYSGCTLYKRKLIEQIPFKLNYDNLQMYPDTVMSYEAKTKGFKVILYTGIKCNHLLKTKKN